MFIYLGINRYSEGHFSDGGEFLPAGDYDSFALVSNSGDLVSIVEVPLGHEPVADALPLQRSTLVSI